MKKHWMGALAGAGALSASIAACGGGSTAADSCSFDTDCKGDRVCEDGACVDPSQAAATGVGATTVGSGGGVSTPGGPEFLTFGSDVTQLSGIESPSSVTFTAVLTDPDGVDDLIGGSLLDASGAPYGAFATSGQEGAYQMTLEWGQINDVAAIDFDKGPGVARTFTAQFFDSAGHKAERSLTVTMTCDGAAACGGDCGRARCGTECISLGTDQNCSACGDDCGSGSCTVDDVCFGAENTNALCSDGADNDGDTYIDCDDFNCSENPAITVCP